jgi:hypothetical protein
VREARGGPRLFPLAESGRQYTARPICIQIGDAMLRIAVFTCCLTLWSTPTFAQAKTVFAGIPTVKISEGGTERTVEKLERSAAVNVAVVISEINGRYYWASRENKELRVSEGGTFITFTAMDGSGYVRVLNPQMKSAASLAYDSAKAFDYVEHLLIGLNSVTYYGTPR